MYKKDFAHSAGAVEYLDFPSTEGYAPPTSVLYMTLNNLMVNIQSCWSLGECGVPFHGHCSQVYSGLGW